MNEVSFNDLIENVKAYNPDEVEKVTKAYNCAKKYHEGQKRESGEDYITHPLHVAYILSMMHADGDTLCAGLLHDTLEDTKLTKEEIEKEFSHSIAELVDGVTKISRLNFISKEEMNYANTRKLITSIITDIRIIIIKLADRLHNMRTLEYKKPDKQKENALETLEIFVPIAYAIGAYTIKRELEDLSFKYLKPDLYYSVKYQKEKIEKENQELLIDVLGKIKKILDDKNIPNEIKIRTKSVYGVYKYMSEGKDIASLHDLLALKIMVDDIDNCYRALGAVHSLYKPVNEKFKDYICSPKTTMYRALHTTVFADDNKLVQARIRTFDMDKIGSYGLTAYWDINKGDARITMQRDLKNNYQFYDSLTQIENLFADNKEFVEMIKNEIFSEKVYVYTGTGEVIELPKGSTIIDYAYKYNPLMADRLKAALVNGEQVPFDYELKNKDIVNLIINDLIMGPTEEWEHMAQTELARKLIRKDIQEKTTN